MASHLNGGEVRSKIVGVFSLLLFSTLSFSADDSQAIWSSLEHPAFDAAKQAQVKDVVLQRDRIRIMLTQGTLQFNQPVAGQVFAAAFRGSGTVQVVPPNPLEAQQLLLNTGAIILVMPFSEATFTFSDGLLEELSPKVQWTPEGGEAKLADLYASRVKAHEDAAREGVPRIFKSLLSGDRKRTAFFSADLKTEKAGWIEVTYDALVNEEILVGRLVDLVGYRHFDTWLSFAAGARPQKEVWRDPEERADFHIPSYEIDASVQDNAELHATSRVDLQYRAGGERVLLFYLDANLRVDSVKDAQGAALAYFQPREPKDRTQSFGDYVAVVLAQPSKAGDAQKLEFHYGGKRVIRKMGSGNYFCESFGWYPSIRDSFATRASFKMNFRSPKKYTLVATGSKTDDTTDGNLSVTTWQSDIPQAVAGFAFGDYKVVTEKVGNMQVDVYANRQGDDTLSGIQHAVEEMGSSAEMALGTLTPASMAKPISIEVGNNIKVFEQYFGPFPYKHLSVTNIPFSYGQGWPSLLFLSVLSFLDPTQRHSLGIKDQTGISDFFRAHETSHQWWGHRVGWKSYHDQWLSEGFAQFSGNLYVEVRQNHKEYLDRLRIDKRDLFARDQKNRTYESLGPVWMGERLRTSSAPRGYDTVIYNKGGYVLHMLRMMLWDAHSQTPDHVFMDVMHDYTSTYDGKAASTEDFQAIVEKHIPPMLVLEPGKGMDWFFRQYVYGTGIPRYDFAYSIEAAGDGKWKVSGTVTQSDVPEGWLDALPVYLTSGKGTGRLGLLSVGAKRVTPFQAVVGFKPDKVSLNANEDILAEIKQ